MSRQRTVLGIALACFVAGGACGFVAGVMSVKVASDFFTGIFRSERAAKVSEPVVVRRPAFTFEHPGNWTVAVDDADYNPDHMFSVESPGQSFVLFVIADGEILPEESVAQQEHAQTTSVMKDATRTDLTTWGTHPGTGVLLAGHHLGITPGTIRIFAFREQGQTYTLIESTYDDDRADVQPGFDLIARTFQVSGV